MANPVFGAPVTDTFGLTNVGNCANPTFADIDGDGDLDAFIGRIDGTTQFFRNTGTATAPGFLSEPGNFGLPDVGRSANPTLADIDGDGDFDAFVGANDNDIFNDAYDGVTRFFRNTGSTAAP